MVKVDDSDELDELSVDDRCEDSVVIDMDMVKTVWWYSIVAVDLAR